MIKVEGVLAQAQARLTTLGEENRLIEAATLLTSPERNLVVIVDAKGLMTGVVTRTDIVRRISQCTGSSCQTRTGEIMTREVISCRPDEWLEDVWHRFTAHRLKNIPVQDPAGRPVGILNVRDALGALLDDSRHEQILLRDYVMGIGYQ